MVTVQCGIYHLPATFTAHGYDVIIIFSIPMTPRVGGILKPAVITGGFISMTIVKYRIRARRRAATAAKAAAAAAAAAAQGKRRN